MKKLSQDINYAILINETCLGPGATLAFHISIQTRSNIWVKKKSKMCEKCKGMIKSWILQDM